MRPYNNYRNPELSQPVSSVENTLTDRTLNASFDLLRSLSESISVDCGSFEISEPTEYYQPSSAPSHVAFVDPRGKEIRTPVESAPAAPVKSEPVKVTQAPKMPSVNPASDMDDDNYDCMNDPNYRTQCVKETRCVKEADSPSFEELLARTAESIAKMREEVHSPYSTSEQDETRGQRRAAENSNTSRSQTKTEPVKCAPKPEKTVDSQSSSSGKKSFLSSISWDKTRKLLFSREAIKLAFLSIAVSALIVSAVIYRNTSRSNNGLPESDDVVMDQSAPEIPDIPGQEKVVNSNNGEFKDSANENYWGTQDNNAWAASDKANPRGLTDEMRGDYQSPTFDADAGFEYSQNDSNGYSNQEDAGRLLAPPHSSNTGNQFVDAIPAYNPGPQYAEVAPAIGAQYSPDEYESPVLEDDTATGEYSETGYNSNFMR